MFNCWWDSPAKSKNINPPRTMMLPQWPSKRQSRCWPLTGLKCWFSSIVYESWLCCCDMKILRYDQFRNPYPICKILLNCKVTTTFFSLNKIKWENHRWVYKFISHYGHIVLLLTCTVLFRLIYVSFHPLVTSNWYTCSKTSFSAIKSLEFSCTVSAHCSFNNCSAG